MDKVILAGLRENIFVYLDDLLVCSPTLEAHIDMLSQVSALLTAGRANNKWAPKKKNREEEEIEGWPHRSL